MRDILKIFAFAAAICTAQGQGTTEAVSSFTLPSGAGFVSGTGGWAFKPNINMAVTSLGCLQYLISGPVTGQGDMQIGLWANGGQLLASAPITATNPLVNFTLYAAINEVILNSGNTYLVGVYSPSGSVSLNLVSPGDGAVTTAPDIQLLGAATGTPGFTYPGTVGAANTMLLGANFQYRPTVPEPSALALLGLGGLAWAAGRQARRKA